jgi:hypothetical protein
MLEIYNEEYKDLLAKKGAAATKKHNVSRRLPVTPPSPLGGFAPH